jgi:hypothetical protein
MTTATLAATCRRCGRRVVMACHEDRPGTWAVVEAHQEGGPLILEGRVYRFAAPGERGGWRFHATACADESGPPGACVDCGRQTGRGRNAVRCSACAETRNRFMERERKERTR